MNRSLTLGLFALTLAATATLSSPGQACSPDEPNGFSVTEESHAADTTPPSEVTIETVEVDLYEGDSECFAEHWRVDLFVSATDDVTAADNLGYLVLDPGATAPTKLDVDTYVTGTYSGNRVQVTFDPDETEATVVVHAVDFGGNVGPGVEVPITLEDDGAGAGCSVAPRGRSSAGWILAALAGLVVGTRRRRR